MTLGLACNQSKVLERCEPKVQPESHIHIPGNVGKCEGMTHTLPSGLPLWELKFRWTFKFLKSDFKGQNSLD